MGSVGEPHRKPADNSDYKQGSLSSKTLICSCAATGHLAHRLVQLA